jgi:hypothetical protein
LTLPLKEPDTISLLHVNTPEAPAPPVMAGTTSKATGSSRTRESRFNIVILLDGRATVSARGRQG